MLVTTVVLINLLIAMMSDTYQRIQASNLSSLCTRANPAISFSSNNLMSSGSLAWPSSLGIKAASNRVLDLEREESRFNRNLRSMHRTDMAPSPINIVTTWVVYLLRMCQRGNTGMHHRHQGEKFEKNCFR